MSGLGTDIQIALEGTHGTPGAENKFTLMTDPRLLKRTEILESAQGYIAQNFRRSVVQTKHVLQSGVTYLLLVPLLEGDYVVATGFCFHALATTPTAFNIGLFHVVDSATITEVARLDTAAGQSANDQIGSGGVLGPTGFEMAVGGDSEANGVGVHIATSGAYYVAVHCAAAVGPELTCGSISALDGQFEGSPDQTSAFSAMNSDYGFGDDGGFVPNNHLDEVSNADPINVWCALYGTPTSFG